jgi:PmbA protein
MIRDGELAEPVRETTVAATLPVILDGIVAIADDLRILPGGATGRTLLVGEMAVSGT